jgi:hypothetical protein
MKKTTATRRVPSVRVAKAKGVKPEPRDCMPGGETKDEIRRTRHHIQVIMRKRMVK